MPMPVPKKGEEKEDFVRRFMSDEYMKNEFPSKNQRFAVAMSQWDRYHRKKKG